ncbi:uncharacterized protein M421DRAFT_28883, partial [Didymella exigua CBS 183.55]
MTRPNNCANELYSGHVHLRFWSLWASPEGFAGYDQEGNVLSKDGVLKSIRKVIRETAGKKTNIYVVKHSLRGAVLRYS